MSLIPRPGSNEGSVAVRVSFNDVAQMLQRDDIPQSEKNQVIALMFMGMNQQIQTDRANSQEEKLRLERIAFSLQNQITQMEAQLQTTGNNNLELVRQVDDLKEQLRCKLSELENQKVQIEKLEKDVTTNQNTSEKLQTRLDDVQNRQLPGLQEEFKNKENVAENLAKKIEAIEAKKREKQAQKEATEKKKIEDRNLALQERKAQFEAQRKKIEDEIKAEQSKVAQESEREKLVNDAEMEKDIAAARNKWLQGADARNEEIQKINFDLEEKRKSKEDLKKIFDIARKVTIPLIIPSYCFYKCSQHFERKTAYYNDVINSFNALVRWDQPQDALKFAFKSADEKVQEQNKVKEIGL